MAYKQTNRDHVLSPTVRDLAWTAGFIEGEGTFAFNCGSAQVKASQVQLQPLEWLKAHYGGSINIRRPSSPLKAQLIGQWTVCGPRAVGLMLTLYAMMSPRRREQIRAVMAKWIARPVAYRYKSHCAQGHLLAGDNCYWNGRRRICRVCKVHRERAKRERQAIAARGRYAPAMNQRLAI